MASPQDHSLPLVTPIHLKHDDMPWPSDRVFYIVASNGLFRCRNHEFFTSCTQARDFPPELAEQGAFIKLRYPKIPRRIFELVIGFFARIYDLHGAEAIALLAWDRRKDRYRIIVPRQEATVRRGWSGTVNPVSVHYEPPIPAAELVPLGSVHSHANYFAYASATDRWDETYRAGLHIVVGRLDRERPDVHVEAVVDGTRFPIRPESVLEGYRQRRRAVPQAWIDRVAMRCLTSTTTWSYSTEKDSRDRREQSESDKTQDDCANRDPD
jgi:proteasome lid subunit RPN8/RPN11